MDTRNASKVAKSERQREASLMREIMAAIGALDGVVVHRNNVGTALYNGARVEYGVGGRGGPDLLVEVRDSAGAWQVLWIEVKTPTGAIEPHQRAWHAAARRMGRACVVARSIHAAETAIADVRAGLSTFYDDMNGRGSADGE